jgi:hypothetical protein
VPQEKSRTETALNNKIAQYDEDMASRSAQLKELNDAFAVESAEYAKLKEHFDRIDLDISRADEEDRILAAIQRREDFALAVLHRACANIQKISRGRIARSVVAKLKAKKGKKGGKKGKK